MEPRVAEARDDRLARQPGAVKKEQQHDPDIRRPARDARPNATRGQQRRE